MTQQRNMQHRPHIPNTPNKYFPTLLLALALIPLAAIVQAQTYDEMAVTGEEAMNAGRYADAIKVYEVIVTKGVTYENIMSIKFELGWAYYLVGTYDKAIPLFLELSGNRAPSEAIKQQAIFLMAECHARLADTQAEGSAERKKNIKESLELHTRFQSDYSKNQNIPASLYGRAYAYHLDNQYDKAEADLRNVIMNYRTSSTAIDAYYLLASVFSQQGLAKIKEGRRDEAKPFLDKAREIFNQLAKQQGNLAMANDSTFSLAETWFSAGLYLEAIQYFREVRSKAEVLTSLRKSLEGLQTRMATMTARGESTVQIRGEMDKIRSQASAVTETPDRMISAYLRISDAFYQMKHYEEVRIICRHLLDFAQDISKMQAYMLLINTYLEERLPDEAAREFEAFEQTFGADAPMAESVNLVIGQLYVQRENYEAALTQLSRSVENYPEAKTFEDALYLKFTVEYMVGQYNEAKATVDRYAEKYPKGKYLPTGLYYKGMSQAALEEKDAALATLSDVLERFPKKTEDFTNPDEVSYQKGALLVQMGKSEDAIKHFQQFIELYKDSALRPAAMYQLGVAINNADPNKFEEAQAILRNISKEHPDAEIAPPAMFQIAVMYFEREQLPEMAGVLREILELHPRAPIIPDVYFWLGYIAKQEGAFDDAVGYFRQSLEVAPDNPRAPDSALALAQAFNDKAAKMGAPTVLPEAQRAIYRESRLNAARAFEDLLEKYADSEKSLDAIPGIAQSLFETVRTKQMSEEEITAWFKDARARHPGDPALQAQLVFAHGGFLMRNREQAKALPIFKEALTIAPDVHVPPEMLTDYAEALKDTGKLEEAEQIYNKILEDYSETPLALAPAWFGLADIKYLQEKYPEAEELFTRVETEFPWFERGKQGRVKRAMILERKQDYAAAEAMFTAVWREEKGEARISASLGVARCQLAKAEKEKRAGMTTWQETSRVASQNLTQLVVLYEAYPEYVSEAYWLLGRACELDGKTNEAKEMYKRVVESYGKFPSAKPAAEQLKRLGG